MEWFPYQSRGVGYTDGELGREGKDWVQEMMKNPPMEDEVIMDLLKMTKQPTKPLLKKVTGEPIKEPRELDPSVFEVPGKGQGIQVERKEWKDHRRVVWSDVTGFLVSGMAVAVLWGGHAGEGVYCGTWLAHSSQNM